MLGRCAPLHGRPLLHPSWVNVVVALPPRYAPHTISTLLSTAKENRYCTLGAAPPPVCTFRSPGFDFRLSLLTPRGFKKNNRHTISLMVSLPEMARIDDVVSVPFEPTKSIFTKKSGFDFPLVSKQWEYICMQDISYFVMLCEISNLLEISNEWFSTLWPLH